MSECKEARRPKELFLKFTKTDAARGIDTDRLITAAGHLAGYLADSNKLLCEIGLEEMEGFIKLLYSLETAAFTKQDMHREIHIINLFYVFLKERGCVTANPVVQLKRQEIKKMLQSMEGCGYRTEYLKEDTDE